MEHSTEPEDFVGIVATVDVLAMGLVFDCHAGLHAQSISHRWSLRMYMYPDTARRPMNTGANGVHVFPYIE